VGRGGEDHDAGLPFLSSFVFPSFTSTSPTPTTCCATRRGCWARRDFLGERRRPWIPFRSWGFAYSTDLFLWLNCLCLATQALFCTFQPFLVALVSKP